MNPGEKQESSHTDDDFHPPSLCHYEKALLKPIQRQHVAYEASDVDLAPFEKPHRKVEMPVVEIMAARESNLLVVYDIEIHAEVTPGIEAGKDVYGPTRGDDA